jgi:hypothetical protein
MKKKITGFKIHKRYIEEYSRTENEIKHKLKRIGD